MKTLGRHNGPGSDNAVTTDTFISEPLPAHVDAAAAYDLQPAQLRGRQQEQKVAPSTASGLAEEQVASSEDASEGVFDVKLNSELHASAQRISTVHRQEEDDANP